MSDYEIHAQDGEIGHVEDFVIDDKTWRVRYLVVVTRNWFPGKRVLLSPDWIEEISADNREIFDCARESAERVELGGR